MIYCVETRTGLIYEVRALGDYVLVRPAHLGREHLLERITFVQFNRLFNAFLGAFLIPNRLTEEDYIEASDVYE